MEKIFFLIYLNFFLLLTFSACAQSPDEANFKNVALHFTEALAKRDYAPAYEMTAKDYRERVTLDQMCRAFESVVPLDWVFTAKGTDSPIVVGETMTNWPDKKDEDVGWAYVSIGGDIYSEAVIVIIARENGALKIRDVEFGRP